MRFLKSLVLGSALLLQAGSVLGSEEGVENAAAVAAVSKFSIDMPLTQLENADFYMNPYANFRKPFKLFMEPMSVHPCMKLLTLLVPKLQAIEDALKKKDQESIKAAIGALLEDPIKEKLEYEMDGLDRFYVEFKTILGSDRFLKGDPEKNGFKVVQKLYKELFATLMGMKSFFASAVDSSHIAGKQSEFTKVFAPLKKPAKAAAAPAPTSLLLGLQFDGHLVFKREGENYRFFVSDGSMDRIKRILRKIEKRIYNGDTTKKESSTPEDATSSKKKNANGAKRAFEDRIKGMSIDQLIETLHTEKGQRHEVFAKLHEAKKLSDHKVAIDDAIGNDSEKLGESRKAELEKLKKAIQHLESLQLAGKQGHYVLMSEDTHIISDRSMRDFVESVGFQKVTTTKGAASKSEVLQLYGTLPARTVNASKMAQMACSLKGGRACDKWDLTVKRLKSCTLSTVALCPDISEKGAKLNSSLDKIVEAVASKKGIRERYDIPRARENLFWFLVLQEAFHRENPQDVPKAATVKGGSAKKK